MTLWMRGSRGSRTAPVIGSIVAAVAAADHCHHRIESPPFGAGDAADVEAGCRRVSVSCDDATAAQWEETIPDLLATSLDGVPGIAVADPWSLWRTSDGIRDPTPEVPRPTSRAVAISPRRAPSSSARSRRCSAMFKSASGSIATTRNRGRRSPPADRPTV